MPHGGNFDGAAGVVAGLVAVAALQHAGISLANDLTVMGIRAEESIWFQVSYIGSRGASARCPTARWTCGASTPAARWPSTSPSAAAIPCALRAGAPVPRSLAHRRLSGTAYRTGAESGGGGRAGGDLHRHPGNFRYPDARIEGSHDHVGLPRRFRRDAAMAGAEFAMALDRLWEEYEARGMPMACTIGRFHTDPASHGLTIVPGAFHFSLDVRAYDEAVLAELDSKVDAIIAGIEQRRGVRFHRGPKARAAVGPGGSGDHGGVGERCDGAWHPGAGLGSPASHDAAAFAAAGVPMGMIFVRNENGSHNPHEAMDIDDFMAGASLLTSFLVQQFGGQ